MMDFKTLMKAQISKSRGSVPGNESVTGSQYLRRSQVEAERQAAYAAEQAKAEVERMERAAKKRKLDEDNAAQAALRQEKLKKLSEDSKLRNEAEQREQERRRRQRLGLPDSPNQREEQDKTLALEEGEEDMPEDELWLKLRALSEPVSLFDESHDARLARYYARIRKAPDKAPIMSKGPIPTSLAPVDEKDMLIATVPSKNLSKGQLLFIYRQIASYMTLLLTEWSIALSARPKELQDSPSGRAAYQSYESVRRDLTPLYRKLENQTLDPDLLAPICEIISYIQNRQYVKANDAYLRLSIGKAAWPIGVTMVGIHERSAREKLHEHDKQAHIMSDEVTRKMLQSLKRCLSFAQTRWPPDDLGQLMG